MKTKEVTLIADGMADEPGFALGAVTPALDRMRREGHVGHVLTVPDGLEPSSDVAILSLLGYGDDSLTGGRGWLEAAGIGLDVNPSHYYARCSVSASDDIDASTLSAIIPGAEFHAMAPGKFVAVSANPISEKVYELPGGEARIWSAGRPRNLSPRGGALVCAVPLVRGIGIMAGMEVITPAGAMGDCRTDMGAKSRAALDAFARHDTVFIHVEAPDEASHMLRPDIKKAMIERLDREIVAPLLAHGNLRVTVVADHITSSRTGKHLRGPVERLVMEV